jgi:hypothetical protein
MKLVKKIEIKLTVKDNPFLKEQLPYLQRHCNFSKPMEDHDYYTEQTELEALIDSDEFIISLDPVEHRNGELTVVDGEIQYIVGLTFKGTSVTGQFWNSYVPYVLLTPSEVFRLIFPTVELNTKALLYPISPNVDSDINTILAMVFGLKNEEHFKYEII